MFQDCRGVTYTTDSEQAVAAFDRVVDGYLGYRADMKPRMDAVMAADPAFGMAHCLQGYLLMMGFNAAGLPGARAALAAARRAAGTEREEAHKAALDAWIEGDPERAADIWEQIARDHPHDILAFRLAHFVNFWTGRADAMLASVRGIERHWSAALPGYGSILACRCFAHEENGYYLEAELAGRAAIRVNPADLWGAHAVAHVLEMTGRRREGIAWVEALQPHWDGGNNLKHHLWWHQALYHLELGDTDRVLALYDAGFRDLGSPLTGAAPDLYIDVQNAASMLYRLHRLRVDVGDRWTELADKAEGRIGDCQSAFTLPHWMMALAATGRDDAASRMLAGMRAFGREHSPLAALVRTVALPATEAVLANLQGRHLDALAAMRPVLGDLYRLGGSHAQQDVLEQVFLDSALKAEAKADVRLLLERVAGRCRLSPAHRAGYAMAARSMG
ncbi:MAG TPA: tetratricopeptide repeat protein [Rhodopila sp.]|uniref:tetratricopeptide repeat protein n=1 Tax=Rhodopila sp. TaxID=2480087 RepID=UPI002CEBBE5C|nr:tetratricopeptide repeat protein [Rhodopila sp.]HVY15168.1 tetratricopeptide repeat protein [Rhodopila sp.]